MWRGVAGEAGTGSEGTCAPLVLGVMGAMEGFRAQQ